MDDTQKEFLPLKPPGTLEAITAEKLCPALGAFTQWVLGNALKEGVSRLYFLARDGWFPYGLARRLCASWELPVECRYLFGSRYAWRLPLYHFDIPRAVNVLCGKSKVLSLETVLRQGGLTQQEREEVLGDLKLDGEAGRSLKERAWLEEQLLNCSSFRACLEHRSRKAFSGLEGYLRQEGLLDGASWALVDSGWMGSTQETLAAVLEQMDFQGIVRGYYAGLYRQPRQGIWDCFFFRPGRDLAFQAGMEPSFFECVFSAPHGMTVGYRQVAGRFLPVLGKPPAHGETRGEMAGVFRDYGACLAKRALPGDLCSQAGAERFPAWEKLCQVMTRPTWEEAKLLGELTFSHRPLEGGEAPLAVRLSEEELRSNHASRRMLSGPPARTSPWLPGSAALYGKCPQEHFQAFQRVRWARAAVHAIKSGARKIYGEE